MVKQSRHALKNSKRIVIKVGTSSLAHNTGRMNLVKMDRLSMMISELINRGHEVVLVSSGAIAAGLNKLNMKERPNVMGIKQALAAVGQCELMNIYSKLFSAYNQIVAKILLTKYYFED